MNKTLIQPNADYLSSSIAQALEYISIIENSEDDPILIDLSGIHEIPPALALSLIVFRTKCAKRIIFVNAGANLHSVFFEIDGIRPDEFRESAFKAIIEGYADKLFTPIISFPAATNSDYKDAVSSLIEDLIIRQLGLQPNVAIGVKYIIEETLDNITEHSHTDRGFIFAQANQAKRYLDISIADRGISSKNLPEAENRGYGIYTSKRMIIEGMMGQYMMISGSSFYLKDDLYDNFFSLPEGVRWEGTIVSFRLYYDAPEFSYTKYIE